MPTSKAFRCTLPMLRDDQLTNLRRWAELHCAQSIVFRDDRGNAVFVGLKANLRTCCGAYPIGNTIIPKVLTS